MNGMTASDMLCLHWDQALALIGKGAERPRCVPRLKQRELSPRYVASILSAVGALIAAPYAEELWRCYRAGRTLAAHPRTEPAPTGERVPQ